MSKRLYGKAALFKGAAATGRGAAARKSTSQPGGGPGRPLVDKSTSQPGARAAGDFKRFTYYLRPATGRALKVLAAEQGRDLSGLVREVLEGYLVSVAESHFSTTY